MNTTAPRTRLSPAEARANCRPSSAHWFGSLAFDWSCIALAFAAMAASNHPLVWIAGFLVIGARQQGLGFLAHDAVHFCATRDRVWNDRLANWLAFWPLGADVRAFRGFHLGHHRGLGTAADPELGGLPLPSAPRTPAALAWRFVGHCLGGAALRTLGILLRFRPRGVRGLLGLGALFGLALASSFALHVPWLLPVWFAVQLTTFSAFLQLRLLLEHTGLAGDTHRITAGPAWRFFVLPHDCWCHDEHHHWPGVPIHRLRAVRRLTTNGAELSPLQLIQELTTLHSSNPPRVVRDAA